MILHFEKISDEQIQKYLQDNHQTEINSKIMLEACQGSIGKALEIKDKQELYQNTEQVVNSLERKDKIDILNMSDFIYKSKDDKLEILNYMNVLFINLAKINSKYADCIAIVEETKRRLQSNANYDMCIDNLLLSLWENVNYQKGNKNWKNIIGIRFKKLGKIYFFNPKGLKVKIGDKVIVETTQGEELAEVLIPNRYVEDEKIIAPLKKVVRIANNRDIKRYDECRKIEKEAFDICKQKIKEHKLNMTLTEVECKFDNSKVIFYFTADGRIDFRDLVKDLAAIYRTRIEMRQIGVRDEVRRIGGNGVCGRELCCCTFLSDFEAGSIKMAKEQNISLNPSKISGNCGRLMCCLKYENEVYEDKLKRLPNVGAIVKTEVGEGEVDGVETLKERVKVKFKTEDGDGYTYKRYDAKDIKEIKDIAKERIDEEELKNKKELEELEKLEKEDEKNSENI